MYIIFVDILVTPGSAAAFLAASRDNAACTRQEPGSPSFEIVCHEDEPERFGFIEHYPTKAHFQAHQQTEHYKRWRAAVDHLMARNRSGTKWLADNAG